MAEINKPSDQATGPNRALATIEIVNTGNPNRILRINAEDYKPEKHVKTEDLKKFRSLNAEEQARITQVMKAIEERHKKRLEEAAADPKTEQDREILALRARIAELEAKEKAAASKSSEASEDKPAEPAAEPPKPPAAPSKKKPAAEDKKPGGGGLEGLGDL